MYRLTISSRRGKPFLLSGYETIIDMKKKIQKNKKIVLPYVMPYRLTLPFLLHVHLPLHHLSPSTFPTRNARHPTPSVFSSSSSLPTLSRPLLPCPPPPTYTATSTPPLLLPLSMTTSSRTPPPSRSTSSPPSSSSKNTTAPSRSPTSPPTSGTTLSPKLTFPAKSVPLICFSLAPKQGSRDYALMQSRGTNRG